jgi:hypothetical protein
MSGGLDWRKDIVAARLKGVGGGKRVFWTPEQASLITDHVMRSPEAVLRRAMAAKSPARTSASPMLTVTRSADSSTSLTWAAKLTDETVDSQNDVIKVDGWDLSRCMSNFPALFSHDPEQLVGQWSYPIRASGALLASATFPAEGVSPIADEVRGMLAAGVLRGVSVAFIAGKFEFSKDPSRPLGITFISGHQMVESSFVSVPANPSALVIGATSAKALDDYAISARKAEAENLISLVKSAVSLVWSAEGLAAETAIYGSADVVDRYRSPARPGPASQATSSRLILETSTVRAACQNVEPGQNAFEMYKKIDRFVLDKCGTCT